MHVTIFLKLKYLIFAIKVIRYEQELGAKDEPRMNSYNAISGLGFQLTL